MTHDPGDHGSDEPEDGTEGGDPAAAWSINFEALMPGMKETLERLSSVISEHVTANLDLSGVAEGLLAAVRYDLQTELFTEQLAAVHRKVFRSIDWDALHALVSRYLPPNWVGLDEEAVTALCVETTWPLVWLPAAPVIADLLAASPDHRGAVLLEHTTEVVTAATDLLDEIHDPTLQHVVAPLREAGDLLLGERHRGAQALAAAALSDLFSLWARSHRLADARSKLEDELDRHQGPISYFRLAVLSEALLRSLSPFWPSRGDPHPVTFNRHATAHYVRPEQYTPLNALVGYMTTVAYARELQALGDEDTASAA